MEANSLRLVGLSKFLMNDRYLPYGQLRNVAALVARLP